LVVLAVALTETPLLHAHAHADAAGWYDEECPLSRLSAGPPSLAGMTPATLAWVPSVEPWQAFADGAAPRRLVSLGADARAPPRAS
jgi:hypothetical protein